jgi:beta-lactamase regulating signal transducer with metallopeptidase domain
MELLYRLFYTIFSMSCMAALLFPVVLILRFCFRRLSKNLALALWGVLFLRAVCPLGMSSPVSLMETWNRRFHILLRSVGLQITPDRGLLVSWRYVYQGSITTSFPYRVCTIFWTVGTLVLLFGTWWKQHRFSRWLAADAEPLIDRIYQSQKISTPVRVGVLSTKIYLPSGLTAKETKNILLHQQLHGKRMDDFFQAITFLICCIHWWNPFLWCAYYLSGIDREYACDEAVVRKIGSDGTQGYVQDIINMQKEDVGEFVPGSLLTCRETRLYQRGEHILYREKTAAWKQGTAVFVVTVFLFCSFCLSALHRGYQEETDSTQESLFDTGEKKEVTEKVIAKCSTKTPQGKDVRLELFLAQGTYQKGTGYEGQCTLRLMDEEDTSLAALNLTKVFQSGAVQKFMENMELVVKDYNGDGTMEVAIGQQQEVSSSLLAAPASGTAVETEVSPGKTETVHVYYLINIGQDSLDVVSDPVYEQEVTDLQAGSMNLSYIQGAGVITSRLADGIAYYVWDEKKGKYIRQDMTEEELAARQSESGTQDEEQNRYTLENDDGLTVMGVDTKPDSTGSQVIRKIQINPLGLDHRTGTKSLTEVEGYYCDLRWAQTDGESNRYAVLIYNGTKGRTFVLFDVEETKICYRQEDGNQGLQKLFRKYGEDEIAFDDNGAVVYSLMEISGEDTLKINFAASAKDDVTLRGSYLYSMSNEKADSLQYTREIG